MLSKSSWLINAIHLLENLIVEIVWCIKRTLIRMFLVLFISRISIVQFFSSRWLPFISRYQQLIENFLSINLNQSSISIIGNSTTIVGFCNKVLNGLPCDWNSLVICLSWLTFFQSSHINCHQIFADLIVRIIKGI